MAVSDDHISLLRACQLFGIDKCFQRDFDEVIRLKIVFNKYIIIINIGWKYCQIIKSQPKSGFRVKTFKKKIQQSKLPKLRLTVLITQPQSKLLEHENFCSQIPVQGCPKLFSVLISV